MAEPFSSRINVVGAEVFCILLIYWPPATSTECSLLLAVGANGSGKSNFFQGETLG